MISKNTIARKILWDDSDYTCSNLTDTVKSFVILVLCWKTVFEGAADINLVFFLYGVSFKLSIYGTSVMCVTADWI